MGNLIAVIKLIAELFPVVITLIQTIENALPAGGQGAAKLELLKTTLQGAFATAQNVGVTFEQVWPQLQPVISGIVSLFNAAGLFKKSA